MSTKARSTKARSTSTKARSTSTKARSTSTKAGKKGGQGSGKLKGGAEVGVENEDQGSGKLKAGAEVGLESDSLDEIKEAAHDTFDNIKSGFKVARKKISDL